MTWRFQTSNSKPGLTPPRFWPRYVILTREHGRFSCLIETQKLNVVCWHCLSRSLSGAAEQLQPILQWTKMACMCWVWQANGNQTDPEIPNIQLEDGSSADAANFFLEIFPTFRSLLLYVGAGRRLRGSLSRACERNTKQKTNPSPAKIRRLNEAENQSAMASQDRSQGWKAAWFPSSLLVAWTSTSLPLFILPEIKCLLRGFELNKTSKIERLRSFLKEGLLRVDSCLTESQLSFEAKNPVVQDRQTYLMR